MANTQIPGQAAADLDPGAATGSGHLPEAPSSRQSFSNWIVARVDLALRLGLLAIILLIGVFFTIRTIPSGNISDIGQSLFISGSNFQNLGFQMAVIGLLALGETFVIITAGIDLSVGAVLGLSAIIVAKCFNNLGLSWPEVTVIVVIFGMLIGAFNGTLVAWAKIPPFIVTLGMLGIARGAAYVLSADVSITPSPQGEPIPFTTWAGSVTFGIPNIFLVLAILAIVLECFLRFTRRGRYCYAIGSNPEAARLSGINIIMTLIIVYAISGCLAGVGGLLEVGRLNVANANFGLSNELDAISAVVLGGASLFGAKGTIIGTILGLVLINELSNGINLINADPNIQLIVEGALLIIIVWVDQWRKRRIAAA